MGGAHRPDVVGMRTFILRVEETDVRTLALHRRIRRVGGARRCNRFDLQRVRLEGIVFRDMRIDEPNLAALPKCSARRM